MCLKGTKKYQGHLILQTSLGIFQANNFTECNAKRRAQKVDILTATTLDGIELLLELLTEKEILYLLFEPINDEGVLGPWKQGSMKVC